MMRFLQLAYRNSKPVAPTSLDSKLCVCLSTDDHQFYRVKILHKDADKVKVEFVDFGNSQTEPITHLRAPAFINIPKQCMKMRIDGVVSVRTRHIKTNTCLIFLTW